MSQIDVPLSPSGFGQTRRADNWWVQPLFVFLGLSSFIVYATWAALQGAHYRFGPYISPFYSPELFGPSGQAWFGAKPTWMPAWVTAAVLILWAPGGFRVCGGARMGCRSVQNLTRAGVLARVLR